MSGSSRRDERLERSLAADAGTWFAAVLEERDEGPDASMPPERQHPWSLTIVSQTPAGMGDVQKN